MNKNFYLVILLVFSAFGLFVACEETEGIDEYANWRQRNDAFIDSIAQVAKKYPDEWKVYKAWNLLPDVNQGQLSGDVTDYIYVQVLKEGEGMDSPLYTDSIKINYRGYWINEKVFDQSYTQEEPDRDFVVPFKSSVSSFVVGFTTAMMYMKEDDRWKVYIPWKLGYGESNYSPTGSSTILGGSTLIFDVDLVEVIPLNPN